MERDELLDRLNALLPAQFDELVFRMNVAAEYLSHGSPQATRAVEVVRYLTQQGRMEELTRRLDESRASAAGNAAPASPTASNSSGSFRQLADDRISVVYGAAVDGPSDRIPASDRPPVDHDQASLLRMKQIDAGSKHWGFYNDEAAARNTRGDHQGAWEVLELALQRGVSGVHLETTRAVVLRALGRNDEASSLRWKHINEGTRHAAFYNDEAATLNADGEHDAAWHVLELARQRGVTSGHLEATRAEVASARAASASRVAAASPRATAPPGAAFEASVAYIHIPSLKEQAGMRVLRAMSTLHSAIRGVLEGESRRWAGTRALSALTGAILIVPDSLHVHCHDLVSRVAHAASAFDLPLRIGVSRGRLNAVEDIDGEVNFLGEAINIAARLAVSPSNPGFVVQDLYSRYVEPTVEGDLWIAHSAENYREIVILGKRHDAPFRCVVAPDNLFAVNPRDPYRRLPTSDVRWVNAVAVAYDLPAFSNGKGNELGSRFRGVADKFREIRAGQRIPASTQPYFSPGGDGGIIVLAGSDPATGFAIADEFFALLHLESEFRKPEIAVRCRIGVHYGQVSLYTDAEGKLRPTGPTLFIADAIAGDAAGRKSDQIIISELLKAAASQKYVFQREFVAIEPATEGPARGIARYARLSKQAALPPDGTAKAVASGDEPPKEDPSRAAAAAFPTTPALEIADLEFRGAAVEAQKAHAVIISGPGFLHDWTLTVHLYVVPNDKPLTIAGHKCELLLMTEDRGPVGFLELAIAGANGIMPDVHIERPQEVVLIGSVNSTKCSWTTPPPPTKANGTLIVRDATGQYEARVPVEFYYSQREWAWHAFPESKPVTLRRTAKPYAGGGSADEPRRTTRLEAASDAELRDRTLSLAAILRDIVERHDRDVARAHDLTARGFFNGIPTVPSVDDEQEGERLAREALRRLCAGHAEVRVEALGVRSELERRLPGIGMKSFEAAYMQATNSKEMLSVADDLEMLARSLPI